MRLPGGNGRLGEDPLLKVGVLMMTLALAFAFVVVVVALLDEPMKPTVATKPAAQPNRDPSLLGH